MKKLSLTYNSPTFSFTPIDFKEMINRNTNLFNCPLDNYISHISQINNSYLGNTSLIDMLNELESESLLNQQTAERIKLHINNPQRINSTLFNLILLGHISAVESFFREIVTKIIFLDHHSFNYCCDKTITYLAANSHSKKTMPESLLENSSFLSKKEVKDLFKDYVDVNMDTMSPSQNLRDLLDEYEKICQIRNAIVHRFSKIGVKNLKKINIHEDKDLIEKKIESNYEFIQKVGTICYNLVIEINNLLADRILLRQVIEFGKILKKRSDLKLTLKWRKDKNTFTKYFELFYSKELNLNVREEYNKLINIYNTTT